jgi:hypothetical protein
LPWHFICDPIIEPGIGILSLARRKSINRISQGSDPISDFQTGTYLLRFSPTIMEFGDIPRKNRRS